MRRTACLTAFTLVAHAALLRAQTIAITGGTVYPVNAPKIANGTITAQLPITVSRARRVVQRACNILPDAQPAVTLPTPDAK